MQPVVMGSALLCHTYHSLCTATSRNVTDIAGCMPLLVSWIYHRFPCFSPTGYDVVRFPLASKYMKVLAGLAQQSIDRHDGRILSLRRRIDALTFEQFHCTPYDDVELCQIAPDWLMTDAELYTWRDVVPIVCFHFVEFHHIDMVKRQLGAAAQASRPYPPCNP
ncbi:hypothetical protein Ahy_B04g069621 isoform B [Arachis hypogaea]|uniref:Aminotransferase-like plant mobile domain-containing protein n=1 Tax=Arachis hypogaea TaxID=3818 RepID=A0A444ZD36_ARAHY|nr:hypothetical protein Ahy_B04g069621 isoform B [Arachis hypogaea]